MTRLDELRSDPGEMLRLTWDDIMDLCKEMVVAIHEEFNPELVIGIAKGGVIPGVIIASLLRKDFIPISLSRRRRDRIVHSIPQFLVPIASDIEGRTALIVDETCTTGETLQLAMKEAHQKGARKVKTAALYVPGAGYVPNWYGLKTDAVVMKPWDFEVFEDGEFVIRKEYLMQMDRLD